jgi:hypothetical protein
MLHLTALIGSSGATILAVYGGFEAVLVGADGESRSRAV